MYTLFGRTGWGSALVEAQLAAYGLGFTITEMDNLFTSPRARAAMAPHNPIAQVPTLLLPDGQAMSESAAITLYLAELAGSTLFVPPPGSPERAAFLRWLVFMVANLYPCFTFADDPARFVDVPAAREPFQTNVRAHLWRLWAVLERQAAGPWFLGERFSALDLYVAVLSQWYVGARPPGLRPRQMLAAACPRLHAIALAADARADIGSILARNFPQD